MKKMPASDSTITDASDFTAVRDHPRFFFDDTLVVVQVENVRFKVHKYQLVQSDTFAAIFAAAEQSGSEGEPVEGSSRENPIKMEDASASDFEALLAVLYAGQFSTHKSEPESSLIIPAFRLANKWGFADLRGYLMPLAEKVFDDVDKILFAQEFGLEEWISPAYTRLCKRKEMLSSEEAVKIGIDGVLLISRIREEWHHNTDGETITNCCGTHPPTCYNCHKTLNVDVTNIPDTQIQGKIDTWVKSGRVFAKSV